MIGAFGDGGEQPPAFRCAREVERLAARVDLETSHAGGVHIQDFLTSKAVQSGNRFAQPLGVDAHDVVLIAADRINLPFLVGHRRAEADRLRACRNVSAPRERSDGDLK